MKRKWELVRQASPNFNNEKLKLLYKVLFRQYIPPKTMQITKMRKAVNYYKDKMGRKKNVIKSKEKRGRSAKFRSQPLQNCSVFFACLLILQL